MISEEINTVITLLQNVSNSWVGSGGGDGDGSFGGCGGGGCVVFGCVRCFDNLSRLNLNLLCGNFELKFDNFHRTKT